VRHSLPMTSTQFSKGWVQKVGADPASHVRRADPANGLQGTDEPQIAQVCTPVASVATGSLALSRARTSAEASAAPSSAARFPVRRGPGACRPVPSAMLFLADCRDSRCLLPQCPERGAVTQETAPLGRFGQV